MKSFENVHKKDKSKEESQDDEEAGITRRDFLKAGVVLGGALTLKGAVELYEFMKNYSDNQNMSGMKMAEMEAEKIEEILEKTLLEKEKKGEIEKVNLRSEEKDIRPDDHKAVQMVLGKYNQHEARINGETKDATKNYWYIKYTADSRLRKSLENAYAGMQPHVLALKEIFKKEGIPEKYIYLAIPESHWNTKEDSPKGARGVYQIMALTARSFGMRVDDEIDERMDVLKSAECCAKHLKHIFDKTGDWDLALSGYNGSYVNRYISFCRDSKEGCSYAGFMSYLEKRIAGLKGWLAKKVWPHRIEPGQTLSDVSNFFGVPWKTIAKHNKIKSDKNGQLIISEKQWLWIPINDLKTKEKIYGNIISGYIENLNYPGKFNAVWEIINEPEFREKMKQRKNF
jgi:hypothetical protein